MDMEKDIIKNLTQSPEINKEKARVLAIVQDDLQRRDQSTVFFRGENLATYTEVSMGQFIGFRSKPEWKKDYQYNVFDPITRDKVMGILSKSGGLYEAEFFNTNKRLAKVSELIAVTLEGFYKDSTTKLNDVDKNKEIMLNALISPKSIWYEGWRYQKRAVKDIIERDEKTGTILKTKKREIIHYNGPWGELIQVEDFIPGSLKIRDIQEQPRITWMPKMQIEDFRRKFPTAKYPEASKVMAHGVLFSNNVTEFTLRSDLKENEVEVIHFFDKWNDDLVIIANGIMLTPIDNPMPFAHKDYPFVWGGFEPLSPFFVYDMPLTMKLLDMQDMNNEILNLTLDMVWRALNEVILVQEGDGINDDVIYGGGMIGVNDPKNFQKLEFGSSFGFNAATNVIDRARRSIESSSLDAPTSGTSGTRQITAREAMIAREAALEITTLFLQNMEAMEKGKAKLRVKNQLDRYKNPIDWAKRIGEELADEAIPVFRDISVRNAKLQGGKRGLLNINITETPRPNKELDKENIKNSKELSQTIDISPDIIREIDFDVEIVPNSSVKKSRAAKVGEARQFLTDAVSMPQILNTEYAAEEYVKALGKTKDDAMVSQKAQPNMPMTKAGVPSEKPEMPKELPIDSMINEMS